MPQTGILWRESANKMQWGINIRWDDYTTTTPYIDVHADIYVRTLAWGMNDAQVGTLSGSRSFAVPYTMVSGSGQSVVKLVGTATLSAQVQSYSGGPTYTFNFQVSGGAFGNPGGTYQWALPARPGTVPTPPSRIIADTLTPTSCRILVSAADGRGHPVTAYEVYVMTNNAWPGSGGNVVATWGGGTGVATGLTPGKRYYFTARARNAVGWSSWYPMQVVDIPPMLPVIGTSYGMRNITRQSATTTGISVITTGGGTLDNVRVQHNSSATDVGATVTTRGSFGDVTVPGLIEGTTYHYRVAVRNQAGWSAYGPWKTFTTLEDAPDDMGVPVFSGITDTSMTATWAAPAMNGAEFQSYLWELSYTSTFASIFRSGNSATPSILITGIAPGTKVYARMRATAIPSNGGFGTGSAKTTGIAPNSGLRVHATVDGVTHEGVLYACVAGSIRELRPMVKLMGNLQTE